MVANLVLHKGASEVSEEVVRSIEAPFPTRTWDPISHNQLLNEVGSALTERGLRVTNKQFALSHHGARLFAVMDIEAELNGRTDYGLALGIRNSIDKSLSAGLCFGSHVFVCDNLAFLSDVVIAKKHTARISEELPTLIRGALDKHNAAALNQDALFDRLKETDLSGRVGRQVASDFIIEAYRQEAIPASGVGRVADLWFEPPHPEFTDRTAWSLHNAFTEYAKARQRRNPFTAARETMVLNQLFLDRWGSLTNGSPSETTVTTN